MVSFFRWVTAGVAMALSDPDLAAEIQQPNDDLQHPSGLITCNARGHHARGLTDNELEKLEKDKVTLTEFKRTKLEKEAQKNWDLFYKRNTTKFFKDRHWTTREFQELCGKKVTILRN